MKTSFGRVFGFVGLLTGVLWLALGLAGIFYGLRVLEDVSTRLDAGLQTTLDNLETVQDSLELSTSIIYSVNDTLETVELTAADASRTICEPRPLLDDASNVLTQDVPDALEGVQAAMPGVLSTASLVDQTLMLLDRFKFAIPIPFGQSIELGLGIDYEPEVPLKYALEDASSNLDGVPETLRDMRGSLDTASDNLATIGEDITALTKDLSTVNRQIAGIGPQLERFGESIGEIQGTIQTVQAGVPQALEQVKVGLVGAMALLSLTQIPSLYVGWLLLSGRLPGARAAS
jgi:ABC-type transporter Mla subunit MlaD